MKKLDLNKKKKKLSFASKALIFACVSMLAVALSAVIAFRYSSAEAEKAIAEEDRSSILLDLRSEDSILGSTLINYDPYETESDAERSLDIDGIEIPGETGKDADLNDAPINVVVNVDGHNYSLLTKADTVGEALEEQHIELGPSDYLSGGDYSSAPENGMAISVIRVDRETRTEVETIPYETVYVWDKDMYEGEEEVLTKGKNGSITRTYTLTYENGVLVSEELSDVKRVEKTDKRIAYGSRSSFSNSRGERIDYTQCIVCYGTVYIPDAKWGYQTYVGERARPGVIAVDPKVIPLGTKVYIESVYPDIGDYGYAIAWDIGGHVKGNWVDMFAENLEMANLWGARDVNVYILEDQSIDIFALRSDYFVWMER
ncbi:MAG: G5 domain-containing protein [Clostridia bacterium]|nr:G5 domain-containing protein [Clostridia bacterium]